MEAPLLGNRGTSAGRNARACVSPGCCVPGGAVRTAGGPGSGPVPDGLVDPQTAALTKSLSTPAGLQTVVRFHDGSNMSLHHRVRQNIFKAIRKKTLNRLNFT